MCERLANATRELLATHQKLYEEQSYETTSIKYHLDEVKASSYPPKTTTTKSHSSSVTSSPNIPLSPVNQLNNNRQEGPQLSTLLGVHTEDASSIPTFSQPQRNTYKQNDYYIPSPPPTSAASSNPQPFYTNLSQQSEPLSSTYSNWNRGNEIDFNSLEFLYDTGLFGQVVFDGNTNASQIPTYPTQQQSMYQNMLQTSSSQPPFLTSIPITTSSDSSKNNTSTFNQPTMMSQNSTSPTTYSPSKSLWN